jgi:ElaB/YqjD/DUF883 family membrane-anchored ribosome-binding protein
MIWYCNEGVLLEGGCVVEDTRNEDVETTERYSRKNPPSNKECALDAIDEIEEDISQIEAKLQFTVAESYASEEEYQSWRRRAISALGYSQNELRFLQKWIAQGVQSLEILSIGSGVELPRPVLTKVTKGLLQQDIRARVRTLASTLISEVEEYFHFGYKPTTLIEAEKQRDVLRATMSRIECGILEITEKGILCGMSKNDIVTAKIPLTGLKVRAQADLAVVKAYIRQNQVDSDWRSVCVKALSRAASQGFKLSVNEIEILNQLEPSWE